VAAGSPAVAAASITTSTTKFRSEPGSAHMRPRVLSA
jgi:hypothetical protein